MVSSKRGATALRTLSATDLSKVSGGTKPKTGAAEKPIYYTIVLRDVLISG
jgi:hypothetical protein